MIAARLVAVLLLLLSFTARAADAVPTEQDPVAAARAVHLAEQLRCLVCQNQTIADSNAELAVDLRRQVREQIAAGRSDSEIVQYMVDRYGEFVLYRPRLQLTTVLLWAGPAVLLLGGLALLVRILLTRRASSEPVPLTPEEHERARRLLAADTSKDQT